MLSSVAVRRILAGMSEQNGTAQTVTKSDGTRPRHPRSRLTGINPRAFSKTAWWRFARDRRERYLSRVSGALSDAQAVLIESMISLEWAALQSDAEGGLRGNREAREHRRLLQKFLDDFEKSLALKKGRNAAEHLAQRTAGRTAADILAGR
jgi:hypothetical protein